MRLFFAVFALSTAALAQAPADLVEPAKPAAEQKPVTDHDIEKAHADFPLATPVEVVDATLDTRLKPLTLKGKTDYYLKATFGPQAFTRIALTTGFSQIGGSEDWGSGMDAYGHRVGSRYAEHLVRRTTQFGIGALRGEDPRFRRSGKEGTWDRVKFQLGRTVVVDMDNGGTSIAVGRLAGSFAGNMLATRWHPADPSWKSGIADTGINLAGDLAMRMFREFWPELKRKFKK